MDDHPETGLILLFQSALTHTLQLILPASSKQQPLPEFAAAAAAGTNCAVFLNDFSTQPLTLPWYASLLAVQTVTPLRDEEKCIGTSQTSSWQGSTTQQDQVHDVALVHVLQRVTSHNKTNA